MNEATDAVYALEGYSDYGYHAIYNQDFSEHLGNQNKNDSKLIDKIFIHPNMLKYTGTLYRGLT